MESYHDDEKDAAIHLHRAMRVSRVFRTSGSRLMATAVIKTHAVFAFPRLADLKALHVVNISVKQIVRMLDATQGLVAPDRFAKVEKFSMALIDMTNVRTGPVGSGQFREQFPVSCMRRTRKHLRRRAWG